MFPRINFKNIFFFLCRYTILFFLFLANQVFAACSPTAATTPAQINIGTYASQNVPAGGLSSNGSGVSATFGVSCSVTLTLQLLSITSWVRYTAQSALQLSNGTDTISYTMASNSTYTPAITAANQSIGGPTGFSLLALAVLGSGNITIPLYIKTLTTGLWPSAGTYTGSQSLVVDGVMCTGVSVASICLGTTPISGTVTFTLKLVVTKSCEFVSVPTLVDFGSVSFLENAPTMQMTATFRCTNQEDYLFYADNGSNFAAGTRRMVGPGGNSIAYSIMQPGAPTVPLSSTSALSRFGTGGIESVNIPFKITTGQSTPVAGTYTDSVRLVIEY